MTLAFLLVPAVRVSAQNQEFVYRLDTSTHAKIISMDGASVTIRDDDSRGMGAPLTGSPQVGKDYYATVTGGCGVGARIAIRIDTLSVHCLDTLYVYSGVDTLAPLLFKCNASTGNIHEGDIIFESPTNITGAITVRFRTDPQLDTARTHLPCFVNRGTIGEGFAISIYCSRPCEDVIPVIDSVFYRTRNGVVYDSATTRLVTVYDTIFRIVDDTIKVVEKIDTNSFIGAHLCIGDGVIFRGHGEYSYKYGYYVPSDETSMFYWNFDNQEDSIMGLNVTQVAYEDYQRQGCYDLQLSLLDVYGCPSTIYTAVKVRTSMNPIKTIYTLEDICNNDSLMVSMGYDSRNATLTLRKVEQDSSVSKTFEVRTFIPDGCNCANPSYFEAPVEFTEFPNKRVQTAADICSICINMEHSFMGDIYMTIVCPTGQEAVLKWGNPSNCNPAGIPSSAPSSDPTTGVQFRGGGETGGGTFLGFPLDGFGGWGDNVSNKCDSLTNPFGIGYDYCFSRDTNYILVTGQNAKAVWSANDPKPVGNFYISSSGYTINAYETVPPLPAHFAQGGQSPGSGSQPTKKPSNHEEKTDYYLPWTNFDELIGCPLNGIWKIRVYDTWNSDNGWIFNWSLDICNVSLNSDCKYEVGFDSLVWTPDPSPQYHDYDLGRYRGLKVYQESPVVSYISTPDTAGTFPILVTVYDEFGCTWDTSTTITSYWTPTPRLGADTTLCGDATMELDATDRHTATQNYSFAWSPFGEVDGTITTQEEVNSDLHYEVLVSNTQNFTTCEARDTITVRLRKQPFPSIYPSPFELEGCAPLTLTFENRSVDAVSHRWDFGDGNTSTSPNPTHTYDEGTYTLKYYALSDEQCIDSIIAVSSISVYPSPKAAFMWEPAYPSVLDPVVQFTNLSEPLNTSMQYIWEMQYSQDNPLSVHTLNDIHPYFDYTQYVSGNPAGAYGVTLIARSQNMAPSGHVIYCSDTVANSVLVINDFLQFPNVVTPNGDGINDRFVIGNLVGGIAYPVNQLDIYNKWGTRVYHKENIASDDDFWDPADMPAGTYFYRFSAKGYNGDVEHNGAIEVIK